MRLRSLAAATVALLIGSASLAPARAATTTVTAGTQPIVAWSESVTGTLQLNPNYVSSANIATNGQTNSSGIGTVVAGTNGAQYTTAPNNCQTNPAQSSNIINFGNVSLPYSSGTTTTACQYENALAIEVTTNDTTGWSVTQQLTIAVGSGFILCAIPNGSLTASGTPVPASSATATTASETTCGGSQETLGNANATPPLNTIIATQTNKSGTFYQGEDAELIVTSATVATTSYSVQMNVTLTLN
jgi:hypothetical protein